MVGNSTGNVLSLVDSETPDAGGDSCSEAGDQPVDKVEGSHPSLNIHLLPTDVIINLMEGFDVKHLIDLTPTPFPLAYEVVKRGCSFVALCVTFQMQEYLKTQLRLALTRGIQDPAEKLLFDVRFKCKDDEPGCIIISLWAKPYIIWCGFPSRHDPNY